MAENKLVLMRVLFLFTDTEHKLHATDAAECFGQRYRMCMLMTPHTHIRGVNILQRYGQAKK